MAKSKEKFRKSYSEQVEKQVKWIIARVNKGIRLKQGTYMNFIERMKLKKPQGNTEKHHIIPLHNGGLDIPQNLIALEVRDHIAAHLILFLEFGNNGDKSAYILRKASSHVDLKTQGQRVAAINRLNQTGWFNSEVQRNNGRRGGVKGGSKNSQAQFEARSKVGKKYGQSVGVSNQSDALLSTINSTLVFQHKDAPGNLFSVPPQISAYACAIALNEKCESMGRPDIMLDLAKVKKGGPWYALLKRKKTTIYGWSIIQIIPNSNFPQL